MTKKCRTLEFERKLIYYRYMNQPRRTQSGGIIIMGMVLLLMAATIFALAWYAFNGGKRSETTPVPNETIVPID